MVTIISGNSSVPTCSLVSCGEPPVDSNTVVVPHVFTFPSVVKYSCVKGHEFSGNSTAMCQANGEWNTTAPSCTPFSCGFPGTPDNASVITTPPTYTYGSIIQYQCDEGFEMLGWPVIECNETKQWNGSLPDCIIVECSDPGSPMNGTRLGKVDSFPFQTEVSFACNNGYQLQGNDSIVCTSHGLWSDTLPSCNIVNCNDPGTIVNGNRSVSGFTYGQTVTYECVEGYELFGSEALCVYREW